MVYAYSFTMKSGRRFIVVADNKQKAIKKVIKRFKYTSPGTVNFKFTINNLGVVVQ